MNKKRNRFVKIVALFVILAMVLGGLAAGIFVMLSGGPQVDGTYKASDGRQMVLKNGTATMTVPGQGQASASYKVEDNTVVFQVDENSHITFNIDGKDLVIENGGKLDRWVRQ
ncbi:MAG: hypothetical protein ACYC99_10410 [Candidatus Geothermincolia bacterium]